MISLLVIPSTMQEKSVCESENMFPMLPQGITPPGTAPAVASMSSINNTVPTPASYNTKNDPRGLSVFKQEKQKVCFRELTAIGGC